MRNPQQICAMPVQISAEIRASGNSGETISAYLTRDETSPSRSRGVSVFTLEIELSWLEKMGRVLVVDKSGNPKRYTYEKAVLWVGKNMPGRAVALVLNIENSAAVAPAWTARRVQAMSADADALNAALPTYLQAAQAKKAKVADWLESGRKDDILQAARAVDWCDYFRRATAPGASAARRPSASTIAMITWLGGMSR